MKTEKRIPFTATLRSTLACGVLWLVAGLSAAHAGATWTGTLSQDWNENANWGGTAPSGNLVINNAGVGVFPIISTDPTNGGIIDINVGLFNSNNTGRLDQRAGTLSTGVGNWMRVGVDAGCNGTYNLADTSTTGGALTGFGTGSGSLNVGGSSATSGRIIVGNSSSTGTVNVNTTGTFKVEDDNIAILLGDGGTSTGNFNLDAGTVQVNSLSNKIGILVGTNGGDGNFRMSGGTVNVTGVVWLGDNHANSNGLLEMSGGSFAASGIEIGRTNGTGQLTIAGGTLNSGHVFIGRGTTPTNTGSATVSVAAGATLTASGEFAVGYAGNGATGAAAGAYTLSGTHKQTGNVFNIGVYDSVKGTLTIEPGADLQMQNHTQMRASVATGNTTTNVVNHNGGSVTFYSDGGTTVGGTGYLDMQFAGSGSMTYNLNGGTLTVPRISSTANGGARVFNFNGGTLKATGATTAFFSLGTGSARANVRNGGAVIDTNGYDVTVAQALEHSNITNDAAIDGGLVKNSAGKLTLTGTNTYTGGTTVGSGTLQLGSGGTGGSLSTSSAISIAPGATLAFNQSDVVGQGTDFASAAITGGGSLVQAGSGTLTLSSANTYTGATTVQAGRLNLTGSLTSPVTVTGGVISGTGSTTGLLTLNGGTIALAGGAATTSLTANGVGISTATTLVFDAPPTAATTYDVVSYGAGGQTGFSSLAIGYRGTLNDNTGDQKIEFTYGGVGTRTWDTTSGTWSVGPSNANWLEGDKLFYTGDTVIFDGSDGSGTVSVSGTVIPASVAFTNASGRDYVIEGGAIGGTTALTKTGGGLVALKGANTYSGGTTINAGTVGAGGGNGTSTNLGSSAVTVNSSGTLRLGYAVTSNQNITTTANAISVAGGTIYADDANQHLSGPLEIASSGATLGSTYNAGTNQAQERDKGLAIDGVVSGSGPVTVQHSRITTNASYITSFVAFSNNANTYSGTITVNENTTTGEGGVYLGINGSAALANAAIVIGTNVPGTARKFGSSPLVFKAGLGSATLGSLSGAADVVLRGYDQWNHTYGTDPIALTVGGNNTTTTYSGSMSGGGSLTKTGTGTMTLTGANTYTGNTTIHAGTLALSGSGSIASSPVITVGDAGSSNTVLDLSGLPPSGKNTGDWTLGSNQTLKGIGTVTTASTGTITIAGTHSPGNSAAIQQINGATTYAVNSIFVWELYGNTTSNNPTVNYDQVNVNGSLKIENGALFNVVLNDSGSTVNLADNFWKTSQQWQVFSSTGNLTYTNGFTLGTVSSNQTPVSNYGSFSFTYGPGSTVNLNWTAVPELSNLLVGGVLAAGLLRRRRIGARA